MNQKTAWITGSASGVGLCLTSSLVRRGYRVLACDLNLDVLKDVAEQEGWGDDQVTLAGFDVCDPTGWDQGEAVIETWGRLDLMLNVAGYLHPCFLAETDRVEIDRHIDINVKGLMFGSHLAAKRMRNQGYGHIINIASLAGVAPVQGMSLYCASKFAVRGFSLSLANELHEHGVAVTVICPDAIETPMLEREVEHAAAALTFSGGRTLRVEDIEQAVFDQVLTRRPQELLLPTSRGLLARVAGLAPGVARHLTAHLRKKGLRNQSLRARRVES